MEDQVNNFNEENNVIVDNQQTTAPAPAGKKKSGFALSLVGFIMSFVAFIDALSCLAIIPLIDAQKDRMEEQYGGSNVRLIFDDSMALLEGKIVASFACVVAAVAFILSMVGMIKFAKAKDKEERKAITIVFAVIGMVVAIVAIIVAIIMFGKF